MNKVRFVFCFLVLIFTFVIVNPAFSQDSTSLSKQPLEIMSGNTIIYFEYKNIDKYLENMYTLLDGKENAPEKVAEAKKKIQSFFDEIVKVIKSDSKLNSKAKFTEEQVLFIENIYNSLLDTVKDVNSIHFSITKVDFDAIANSISNMAVFAEDDDKKVVKPMIEYSFCFATKSNNQLQKLLEIEELADYFVNEDPYQNVNLYAIDLNKIDAEDSNKINDSKKTFNKIFGSMKIYFFFSDNALFMTNSRNEVKNMIDNALGKGKSSVANTQTIKLPEDVNYDDCYSYMYCSVASVLQEVKASIPADGLAQFDAVDDVIGFTTVDDVVVWSRTTPEKFDDGMNISFSRDNTLYLSYMSEPSDKSLYNVIPDDALIAYVGEMKDWNNSFNTTIELLQKAVNATLGPPSAENSFAPDLKKEIQTFENKNNIKLSLMFKAMGPEYGFFMLPPSQEDYDALNKSPEVMFSNLCVIGTADNPAALVNYLITLFYADKKAEVKTSNYKGAVIKKIENMPFYPIISFMNNNVFVFFNQKNLEYTIDAIKDERTIINNQYILSQINKESFSNNSMSYYIELKGYLEMYMRMMDLFSEMAPMATPQELSKSLDMFNNAMSMISNQLPILVTCNQYPRNINFNVHYGKDVLKLYDTYLDFYPQFLKEMVK